MICAPDRSKVGVILTVLVYLSWRPSFSLAKHSTPTPVAFAATTLSSAVIIGRKPCQRLEHVGYVLPCNRVHQSVKGEMLSETWERGRLDTRLRANLFHGLSRIMLNLARIPLPQIGSFSLDKYGYLHLGNRPLTLEIQQLENESIPVDIQRDTTYASVHSYVKIS